MTIQIIGLTNTAINPSAYSSSSHQTGCAIALVSGYERHQFKLVVAMPKDNMNAYDYGECENCDTPLQEQRIKQDFWIRDELIVLDNVLAGVCPQCGAKVVRADIGSRIADLLNNPERIATAPHISVPVLSFDE